MEQSTGSAASGRKRYSFSPRDYNRAKNDYNVQWKILDANLYRLCDEEPRHNRISSVNAKVFIIGLTYETGIKRLVRTKSKQGSSVFQASAS
jgi:hypothetical protein